MELITKLFILIISGVGIIAVLYYFTAILMREDTILRNVIDEQKKTLEQLKDAYKKTEEKLKRVQDLTDRLRYIRANKKER